MARKASRWIGGVVSGTWSRRGDEITLTWCAARPRPQDALEEEVGRLATVLGRDLRLSPRAPS